jgi:acetylornithine deacetylase/succinyl-diaminopimelate desuccinylase-like protein
MAGNGSDGGFTGFLERERARLSDELDAFLRIPSVSAKPEHDGDTRAAAHWVASDLERSGFQAEVADTPGHPVVVGEWRGAGADAPTILIYGHYDVQPAEPFEKWTSPPFEPEVRDGRIARGAADDKGQVFLHLKALEAHLAERGSLPVNVIVVIEGEEEIGSPNLLSFVEANRERLACDAVVISDSAMFAPGLPSLLFSLRGMTYLQIEVDGPASDLHSGAYGGSVMNPAMALAKILASMTDDVGRVTIPGFYDSVVEWDEAIRNDIRALPFDEDAFRGGMGAPELRGEEGFSTLERLWIRPTCEVNGLLSGYTGEGAKTVLPSTAMAKVSFRLVPDQDSREIARLVMEHVRSVTPSGVTVRVEELHGGQPWRAKVEGKLFDAATNALERAFGKTPVLTGEGGSIPIVSDFERVLGAPALLVGFALPGANMHAPDEWFPEEHVEKGILALAYLYEELAGGP